MDQPEHGIEHVDKLAGQNAVVLARLRPVLQRPGEVHDSHLGFPVEWDAGTVAKDLLTAPAEVTR